MNKLVILYYHDIVPEGEGFSYQKLEVSKFEEQMKFLMGKAFQTLLFSDLDKPLPEKPVIVSFDDGFRSVYEKAAPIMKKYGIKGNVYLPTAYIGKDPKFMSWEMVQSLYITNDWYFAAHTHNHVDIRKLDEKSAKKEISLSHEEISQHLGYTPDVFCMPYGAFDKRSADLVRKIGNYQYILGSFYGAINVKQLGNAVLPRIGVSNDDTIEKFEDKLNGKYNWKGPLQRLRLMISNIKGERVEHYEY